MLVGIDGATFSVIDPMVTQGKLPTLTRLMAAGARAPLKSQRPMTSPALWTTIATGRNRGTHGITGFKATAISRTPTGTGKGFRMVGSYHRRSPALWDILGPFGQSVGIVGWWASWPAEPVNGWLVSDRFARSRWSEWLDAKRNGQLTFPGDLAATLTGQIVDPAQAPIGELSSLADFNSAELDEIRGATKPLLAHGPSVLKFAYCAQRTYENVALLLLEQGQPDLTAVYLIAADPISHTFWHFYKPDSFSRGGIDRGKAKRLGKTVPNIYGHNDAFIAKILPLMDADTVVLLVSDHGFRAAGKLPKQEPGVKFATHFDARMRQAIKQDRVTIGQPGAHHIDGIFIASGGPIRPGVKTTAKILDIAPTVLALMGLPVPKDMPGRVLEEIVEPAFWLAHPIHRIPSYEPLIKRTVLQPGENMDDETALEMLRALGYVR